MKKLCWCLCLSGGSRYGGMAKTRSRGWRLGGNKELKFQKEVNRESN